MSFTVYPAIDVRGGRVVRLAQGDYARETAYPDDPETLARQYAEAGAGWLHLVDLDAARTGGWQLAGLVARIRAHTALRLQAGGGIRNEHDVRAMLTAGVDRVVVGSLAVLEPERVVDWLDRFGGGRLVVALDTRQSDDGVWQLSAHGWTTPAPHTLPQLAARFADAGLRHLLCTDIARDGMLAGPNLSLYRALRETAPGICIQASGGARDIGDVAAARDAGCGGIVLGRALLEGRMGLREALAC